MTEELQTLSSLVKMFLEERSPILSGNMMREIVLAQYVEINDNEVTLCIDAPFYDMKLWKEKGVILHKYLTGKPGIASEKWPDVISYAHWVNEVGAFGTHNKSMHWVNRAINEACSFMFDAELTNKLKL